LNFNDLLREGFLPCLHPAEIQSFEQIAGIPDKLLLSGRQLAMVQFSYLCAHGVEDLDGNGGSLGQDKFNA
jgi:hypothetical protein